jgi:hypothetical protein
MDLAQVSKTGIDISSETEILSYQYTGSDPREVVIRSQLGVGVGPIAGGAPYQFRIYINDVVLQPLSTVPVDTGVHDAILISRAIPIRTGDTIRLTAVGTASDQSISALTTLRDVTPVHRTDILGAGTVSVDHDYGGDDALAVMTSNAQRIADASILVYRQEDYVSGRRDSLYIVGRTTTDVNGRWRAPVLLDPGVYVLLVSKQNVIATRDVTITVG